VGCARRGPSSDPPDDFGLPDWADVLAAFIQTLGLQHVHVGGLSWGAGLALELYRRYPTMVRSLILMGAYAGWTGSLPAATVEQRLQLMERNSRLPPEDWAPALIRTLVADDAREETRNELASPSVRRSGRRSGRVGSFLHLRLTTGSSLLRKLRKLRKLRIVARAARGWRTGTRVSNSERTAMVVPPFSGVSIHVPRRPPITYRSVPCH
jgi:pimeloyl-ACP methyl ester carboxylesterase